MQRREVRLCLATCDSREAQSLALVFPVEWQVVKPLEMPGGQFGRLPARHDGLDNIGREEGEGKQSADLAGWNTLLIGDVIDAGCIARRQLSEPGMSPGDGGDQNRINRIVVLASRWAEGVSPSSIAAITRRADAPRPSRRSASRRSSRPPSDEMAPPSKFADTFLRQTAGRSKGRKLSSAMAGVALVALVSGNHLGNEFLH